MRRAERLCRTLAALALAGASCIAFARTPPMPDWPNARDTDRMIVVAVGDKSDPTPAAGATPRGYDRLPDYAGGTRGKATAQRLSAEYGLREVSAWSIEPLRLRCMVFALADGDAPDAMLERLARDRRVRIAQPLNEFRTLTLPAAPEPAGYNDPYLQLQHGFSTIEAASAQRWTRGGGVSIAVIDTALDANHPDLAGRVAAQRNFVGAPDAAIAPERHGTEVAGVISAVANNRLGIVGVAPDARLYGYRACWPVEANASAARCNSYTLALALAAAIASDARIINLSLGGPRDALLEELVGVAVERGAIVIGAVPPDRRMDGFPVGARGVIAVRSTEDPAPDAPSLAAPGRDILTLEPGGSFDYASGSSLATAQVSGAVALLLALKPKQDAGALYALLNRTQSKTGASIDVCAAVEDLRPGDGRCDASPPSQAPATEH
jgi:subtilisin family serine protease